MNQHATVIAVIGLGYVGLPLAVEFGRKYPTIGYDVDDDRISELASGHDRTLEVDHNDLKATALTYTSDPCEISRANVFLVTTPTPIDKAKQPDLSPLLSATETIASKMAPGSVIVYESTVYPGATEEECVPLLEKLSGLHFNKDFFVGYSPERINPGDKEHRLATIKKVTSGSTPEAARFIDRLYATIITAGTHPAPSIKVAEAAKVIENTQRDVNIALINELAILFGRLEIDTQDVLDAANTKWNFLPFRPGLVGGHCIGVDPYYLTYKAQQVGYHPEIILAGRRLNDSMGPFVASQLVKRMATEGLPVKGSRVLILGLTFKENTPDLRNSRVIDLVKELAEYHVCIDVHDPWPDPRAVRKEYGIELVDDPPQHAYDAVVIAVAHRQFCQTEPDRIRNYCKSQSSIVYDLRNVLPKGSADIRL